MSKPEQYQIVFEVSADDVSLFDSFFEKLTSQDWDEFMNDVFMMFMIRKSLGYNTKPSWGVSNEQA